MARECPLGDGRCSRTRTRDAGLEQQGSQVKPHRTAAHYDHIRFHISRAGR